MKNIRYIVPLLAMIAIVACQDDDVVGGEHRQHRYQTVEQEEQGGLTALGLPQHLVSQETEEADLVQIHRHHGHGEEQEQDLDGVDVPRPRQSRPDLGGSDEAAHREGDSPAEGCQPENADLLASDHDGGLGENQSNESGAGDEEDGENGDGGGGHRCTSVWFRMRIQIWVYR